MSPQPLHLAPRKFEALIGLGVALVMIAGSLYPLPAIVAGLFPERAWLAIAATSLIGVTLGSASPSHAGVD